MTASLLRCLAPWLLTLQGLCGTVAAVAEDFLPPEQAFRFGARAVDAHQVEVVFTVADGYYLYRDRYAFATTPAGVKLGPPSIPRGPVQFDEAFGKRLETHRGRIVIRLPVESAHTPFVLTVTSQGCADAGLCYPPMQSTARLSPGPAPVRSVRR
ncbi:MAG: protein-disulfide reductase DsbD N-terminal domain-containing protein [Burkholderiaceae bacterium]|nr:protein-disulfide reductase DsbD N-terminal domain-containing protein [Burkholderiaceae bacterium]